MTERYRESSRNLPASYRKDVRWHLGQAKPWRVKAHPWARRCRGQP
jgi:hypothetical protein